MKGQQAAGRVGAALKKRLRLAPRAPFSSLDRAARHLHDALIELARAHRAREIHAAELERYTAPVHELARMLLAWSNEPDELKQELNRALRAASAFNRAEKALAEARGT